ncbi:MAG: helix-turn-helix domain-containing protein [Lachnospiraceae bacterium]
MQIAEYNTPVAENIVEILKRKGLKQVYIAEKAGYKRQEFNDMLNGRRLIRVNDVVRISSALGVDANYLYGIEKGA